MRTWGRSPDLSSDPDGSTNRMDKVFPYGFINRKDERAFLSQRAHRLGCCYTLFILGDCRSSAWNG